MDVNPPAASLGCARASQEGEAEPTVAGASLKSLQRLATIPHPMRCPHRSRAPGLLTSQEGTAPAPKRGWLFPAPWREEPPRQGHAGSCQSHALRGTRSPSCSFSRVFCLWSSFWQWSLRLGQGSYCCGLQRVTCPFVIYESVWVPPRSNVECRLRAGQ